MDRTVRFFGDESGASAAEYALILGFVAAIIIGALSMLGHTLRNIILTDAALIKVGS